MSTKLQGRRSHRNASEASTEELQSFTWHLHWQKFCRSQIGCRLRIASTNFPSNARILRREQSQAKHCPAVREANETHRTVEPINQSTEPISEQNRGPLQTDSNGIRHNSRLDTRRKFSVQSEIRQNVQRCTESGSG